jgi:hypothetical protein
LEEIMRRRPVDISRTARAFQIASLVLVLLAVLGILVRDIAYRGASATARAPATQKQQILQP